MQTWKSGHFNEIRLAIFCLCGQLAFFGLGWTQSQRISRAHFVTAHDSLPLWDAIDELDAREDT